ncbi:MAG TPA: ATP-binding protein, partial [Oligoflexia bacterium]|nr:ATP-binding protein [Oligoflexia bacterium]
SVVKNELGKPIRMRGSHVDITQRKAHESEREITISLLHLLGTSNSTAELLRSVTRLMSAWSGCAAVGIRLRNGDDFPYCETRGFPAEFLELENRLCALDHKGEIQRDSSGNPVFECMCGNVICGRFNPQLPFFTDYGSFWTNSTTALLANTTPADRQGATRNRCNGQGYESVALIPLRHGMETLGLLQFNHPQRDMFSKEKISLFERLAANLAIGLAQRRAVENLQASENRFRLFYEQSPGPYQSLDKDGHFIEVNNAWLSALKYERQEVIGAWFGDFLAGDGPALFPERFTRFKETGEAHEIEYEMKQKDGGIITVSFEGRVMRDEAGKFLRTHCVFFDISARKHAEAEKARLEEHYNQSQKLESVGRLAGGVAHDLNNLLTPMLGYSEMLLDELQSNNSCRDTVQEIIRAGERAQELVNQLLAFSRKQTLEVRLVDLNAVISGIKRLLRRTIREDVLFDVLTDRDVLPVLGDTGQLEQVLINLAVNAQDAMPNGGKLTITTGRGEITQAFNDEQIEPQVNTRLAAYAAVTDTGCGMSAELQEHIFEPFFTTKEKGRGTGLGLATVYGIMKQHNGSIKVDSAPGCGTTITCYLPLQESLRSEAKPSANDSADSLRGTETILLVEDDKLVCGMTQMLLERWGYSVVVAHHCREALLRLAEYHGPLHLLLTDVVMPEMNGKELFAEISKTRPELKVLYMSGYSGDILAQHGVLDPGVQFVKKPFKISDLAVKIRKVLERP